MMENSTEIDKGIDVQYAVEHINDKVHEMINAEFEAVDGTIVSDLIVTVKIESSVNDKESEKE